MTEEVKTMKYLLIRADDLGYSEGVNYGIAATVAAGLVRSVGVMTNMPAGRPRPGAAAWPFPMPGSAHQHLCGPALTDPSHIPSLCTPEGEFRPSRTYREAAKAGRDFVVLEEVIEEIEAQYRQFKALTGREPDYFEGHAVASAKLLQGAGDCCPAPRPALLCHGPSRRGSNLPAYPGLCLYAQGLQGL